MCFGWVRGVNGTEAFVGMKVGIRHSVARDAAVAPYRRTVGTELQAWPAQTDQLNYVQLTTTPTDWQFSVSNVTFAEPWQARHMASYTRSIEIQQQPWLRW